MKSLIELEPMHPNYLAEITAKPTNVNWQGVVRSYQLSEDFLTQYGDYVPWSEVYLYQVLSPGFVDLYHDKVNWEYVSQHTSLTEELIHRYQSYVDWSIVCQVQSLTEGFIAGHVDHVDWNFISSHQELSCEFITTWSDKVNWLRIALTQDLSEELIVANLAKLDLAVIIKRFPAVYDKYNLGLYATINGQGDSWSNLLLREITKIDVQLSRIPKRS